MIDAKIRDEERKPGVSRPVSAAALDILETLKASMERLKKPVAVAKPAPQPVPVPDAAARPL